MNLHNLQIMKISKYYIKYPYIFDIITSIVLLMVLLLIEYPYWELPEYWLWIISIFSMLIFTNSDKILRIRKSKQFKRFAIQFVTYVFLYFSCSYLLNLDISNIFLFNIFISILIVTFIRILFYTISIWILFLNSNTR